MISHGEVFPYYIFFVKYSQFAFYMGDALQRLPCKKVYGDRMKIGDTNDR